MNPVIVERPPADNQGPDISDALITTEAVAIARGTAEIDRACSDRRLISGVGPVQDYIAPGSIIAVTDAEQGVYRAKLTDFAITIELAQESLTAQTAYRIEALA